MHQFDSSFKQSHFFAQTFVNLVAKIISQGELSISKEIKKDKKKRDKSQEKQKKQKKEKKAHKKKKSHSWGKYGTIRQDIRL
ncbi:hypothetical protein pb186bvf_014124 [Paramecium bursaria]